jgi:hypothetical protein
MQRPNKTCNDRPSGWTAKSAAPQQRGPFTQRYVTNTMYRKIIIIRERFARGGR